MAFDVTTIGLMIALAVAYGLLAPRRLRGWLLFAASVIGVFLLQPALPIRFSDYALPAASLFLTAAVWYFTRDRESSAQPHNRRENGIALALMLALALGITLIRFLPPETRITPSRPPDPLHVALMFVLGGVLVFGMGWLTRGFSIKRVMTALILLMIALFVALKLEPLAVEIARAWRGGTAQDTTLAAMIDLNWLGFSYIAFRLIHTLRDRQTGLLPALNLREYVTYVVFFPSLIAGPIDRAERFSQDFAALPTLKGMDAARWQVGLVRIAFGLFKKFVIADTLAQGMALDTRLAELTVSTPYTWVLVYGYALRLFFDFSGYSDIAIGLGILFGIKLPENFNRPYLKTDITGFWQSWHMTLSSWARFYIFTPLSRALLMREPAPSSTVIVLAGHLATMIVIGLWHGITWNFFIWGLWHALGLFVHKQWSDRTRKWYRGLKTKPTQKRLWSLFAWFITFHFVVFGWVWFALPTPELSLRVFDVMFSFGR